MIQARGEITLTLAPFDTRSSGTGAPLMPTLITPRNTAVTETRPIWRWNEVDSSNGYQLTVINAVTGQSWQSQTSATELIYPVDAPPLLPGSTYLTQLKSIQPTTEVDESFFYLLDDAGRQNVIATTAAIRALSPDPVTTAFLLVEYYQTQELYSAAIKQLESIANKKEIPGLTSQLGDLYFYVGLYDHARKNYQAALADAELTDDLVAQATALVGLGRIAYTYGESKKAIDRFQEAETLYRAAGEAAREAAVTQLLSEAGLQPNSTIPVSSPTP